MRVLRDVVVDRLNQDELMAISHAPGVAGEEMSLDLVGAGTSLELRVRVIESRPVIIDGTVRHRVRLYVLQPHVDVELTAARIVQLATNTGAEAS